MSKLISKAALAIATGGLFAAVPAAAVPALPTHDAKIETGVGENWNRGRRHWRDRDYNNYQAYSGQRYNSDYYNNRSVWRGDDGRYYCRRSNGTTGLLIGGAAGALIGREVAGRGGDRTLGAILGAAGGALLGREVDRGGSRSRCR